MSQSVVLIVRRPKTPTGDGTMQCLSVDKKVEGDIPVIFEEECVRHQNQIFTSYHIDYLEPSCIGVKDCGGIPTFAVRFEAPLRGRKGQVWLLTHDMSLVSAATSTSPSQCVFYVGPAGRVFDYHGESPFISRGEIRVFARRGPRLSQARPASSVWAIHGNFGIPKEYCPILFERSAMRIYGKIRVTKTFPGTFFSIFQVHGFYCGIQSLPMHDPQTTLEMVEKSSSDTELSSQMAILSLWDDDNDGGSYWNDTTSKRSNRAYSSDPNATNFGGEGDGIKILKPFSWKVGAVVTSEIELGICKSSRDFGLIATLKSGDSELRLGPIYRPRFDWENLTLSSFIEDFWRCDFSNFGQFLRGAIFFDFEFRSSDRTSEESPPSKVFCSHLVRTVRSGLDAFHSQHVKNEVNSSSRSVSLSTGGLYN